MCLVITLCLMFNVRHQLHKSTFLVCKNEGNEDVSDSVGAPLQEASARDGSACSSGGPRGPPRQRQHSPSGSVTRAPSPRRWCWTPCVLTSSLTRRYWPRHTAWLSKQSSDRCTAHTTQPSVSQPGLWKSLWVSRYVAGQQQRVTHYKMFHQEESQTSRASQIYAQHYNMPPIWAICPATSKNGKSHEFGISCIPAFISERKHTIMSSSLHSCGFDQRGSSFELQREKVNAAPNTLVVAYYCRWSGRSHTSS